MKALALLCLLAGVALAQPTPGPPGLVRVNHDATMTGDGKSLTPLSTRLAVGGGLQGGGAVSLGLGACPTGQVWQSTGTAWACADNASSVSGTLNTIAMFTPDGAHVGNSLITQSGTTVSVAGAAAVNATSFGDALTVSPNATHSSAILITNALTGSTIGRSDMHIIDSSTYNTTSGPLNGSSIAITSTASISAGGNPLTNYGLISDVTGGTSNYSFYGTHGLLFNNDAVGFGTSASESSAKLLVSPSATTQAAIMAVNSLAGSTVSHHEIRAIGNGTYDTTSGALQSVGLYATISAARSAGGNPLTNYGVLSDVTGGDVNYAFFGSNGLMHNAGAVDFASTLAVTGNAWAAALITGGASGSKWSSGTGVPAISCAKGDHFSRTDGGAGSTDYDCTATNTWTALSSTVGTVTSVGATAPITTTGGATPTIAISEGNGITNSGGAIVANLGAGLTFSSGAIVPNLPGGTCSAGTHGSSLSAGGTLSCSADTDPGIAGTANTTTKFGSATTVVNAWPLDDATTWGVASKFTITEASGNFRSFGTGTVDGALTASSTSHLVGAVTDDSTFTATQAAIGGTGLAGATLNVTLANASSTIGDVSAWSNQWATFGTANATGAALGISFNSTTGAIISALAPLSSFYLLTFNASQYRWLTSDTVRMAMAASGLLTVGVGTDAPGASNTTVIVENAGATCSEVRDATNDVESENCVSSSGGFGGTYTNNSYFLQTNATNALKINTSQRVEALADFLADGNTTLGAANTNTLTVTAKVASHVYYTGTTPTYSCAGATVHGNDMSGWIDTPDTNCTLTFAGTFGARTSCNANASTNIPVGVDVDATGATVVFTMGSKPARMTYSCTGEL